MRSCFAFGLTRAALGLTAAAGCRPEAEAPPPAPERTLSEAAPLPTLVAARAVSQEANGETYVFDDDFGPQLCFGGPVPAQTRVMWRTNTQKSVTLTCTEAPIQASCLRCQGQSIATGPGTLVVSGRPLPISCLWRPPPTEHQPVKRALELAAAGRRAEALVVLDRARQTGARWDRAWAAVTMFMWRYRSENGGAGAIDDAIRAAEILEEEGIPSQASKRYRMAGHLAAEAGRFAEAAAHLTRAEALVPDLAKDRARLTHEIGALARHLERFRRAEPILRRAVRDAAAAGQRDDMYRCAQTLALTYGQLGRFDDALRVSLADDFDESIPLPQRAEHQTNLADFKSKAMLSDALPMRPEDVDRHLIRASELFALAEQPVRALERRVELAWWAAQTDRLAVAKRTLNEIGKPEAAGETRWLIPLTRAAVLLAENRPADAERLLAETETAIRRERKGEPTDLAASAAALRGRSAQAVGDLGRAAEHFERGLYEVERLSAQALIRRSAGALLQRLSKHRRRAVESLVRAGQPGRALERADQTRTLLLRRLRDLEAPQDRARWKGLDNRRTSLIKRLRHGCVDVTESASTKCKQQLREDLDRWGRDATAIFKDPPRQDTASGPPMTEWLQDGEGLIAIEPIALNQWRWFHLDGRRVTTGTTAEPTGDWLKAAGSHEHLFVVVDAVDVVNAIIETFAPGEGPSVTSIPAGSWLRWKTETATGPPLIIVDPESELASTEAEGRWLHTRWPDATLFRTTELRRNVLTERLRDASRLHFAGHGRLGGSNPWSTFVDLGPAGALTLEDIILYRPRFALAVLNGCDTGTTEQTYEIGLPQALMVTGTRTVIATVRPVLDASALRFVQAFYDAQGTKYPARAFRQAVDTFRRADDPTWQDFRIWGHR